MDRANRWYDDDGRLHVARTNLSKANVCPYYGREIPGSAELGLEPDRVYQLLRHPDELQKAAETWNNLPLLLKHVEVTSDDHQPDLIGGTISAPVYRHPYLQGSLTAWSDEAIAGIESGELRELSSAYRYDADMTPGEYEGVAYDGVMRNLRGNHVALVDVGRAGADVLVADSIPLELKPMAALSRQAALVKGALSVHLKPKMAADSALPDLNPILATITQKNFKASKPKLVAALKRATKGKLAADADIEDVVELLDTLGETSEEVADVVEAQADTDEQKPSMDADPMEALLTYLDGKLSPEELAEVKAMLAPEPAADAEAEKKDDKPVPVTKAAMDAALKVARSTAERGAMARFQAIRTAERDVAPIVGEITTAMDSAEAVYKFALDHLEVDTTGVDPSAFPALVKMARDRAKPAPAMDRAIPTGFKDRFPSPVPVKHQ